MNIILWIVIITSIAGVAGTGLGGLLSAFVKRDSEKTVSLFLSFAAGIMLSVVCFDLITDALFAGDVEKPHLVLVISGVLVGYIVIYILNRLIDKATDNEVAHIDDNHPKTADDLDELIHSNHLEVHKSNSSSLFAAGVVMAFAIALHNLPEGMVIGASFAGSGIANLMNNSGITLAIVIGLHNIPEGMSIAVPLIAGGMNKVKAVIITALSGSPTIIGAILGYCIGEMGYVGLSLSLSFASGAMLYVVFGELLPEVILMWKSKLPALVTVIGMLLGLVIIYV